MGQGAARVQGTSLVLTFADTDGEGGQGGQGACGQNKIWHCEGFVEEIVKKDKDNFCQAAVV